MDLESLLREYARLKRLGKLEFDSTNPFSLLINNQYLVTFERSIKNSGFFIFSSLGTIPPGSETTLGLMALNANLFGKETGRASIGYVETTRTLVLFEYFDEEEGLTFVKFNERLDEFLQHLIYLSLKFESETPVHALKNEKKDAPTSQVHKKLFYA